MEEFRDRMLANRILAIEGIARAAMILASSSLALFLDPDEARTLSPEKLASVVDDWLDDPEGIERLECYPVLAEALGSFKEFLLSDSDDDAKSPLSRVGFTHPSIPRRKAMPGEETRGPETMITEAAYQRFLEYVCEVRRTLSQCSQQELWEIAFCSVLQSHMTTQRQSSPEDSLDNSPDIQRALTNYLDSSLAFLSEKAKREPSAKTKAS